MHVFKNVHENLLEDHDDDQVSRQCRKVLVVADGNKVRDVSVHELEHVDLVDEGVLIAAHVTMILVINKFA